MYGGWTNAGGSGIADDVSLQYVCVHMRTGGVARRADERYGPVEPTQYLGHHQVLPG